MRLLWVVPRWARGVVGGAETLVGGLARLGQDLGWAVEIATTCAVDHETWANALPSGESTEGGLRVSRFPVGPRDVRRHDRLHAAVVGRRAGYADQLEWLAQGVWSPELGRFLEEDGGAYDLVVFSPYLFGTTVWGAQIAPERSALVPCLHDEPYAYLPVVARVIEGSRGCLFNAPAEQELGRRLCRVPDGEIVGMPFRAPAAPPAADFARGRGIGPYILYAGRLEQGKRVHVLVDHAVRYARERPGAPRLVLMGRGGYRPPPEANDVVVEVGFLDEEEKRAAYRDALAVVNPSHMESLSLVLMEAWLEGAPVMAAAGSAVMRDHVTRSGGGLLFSSYREFRAGVDALRASPERRNALAERGRAYVLEVYGADAVRDRLRRAVERMAVA